jgi:hypothetical protein
MNVTLDILPSKTYTVLEGTSPLFGTTENNLTESRGNYNKKTTPLFWKEHQLADRNINKCRFIYCIVVQYSEKIAKLSFP